MAVSVRGSVGFVSNPSGSSVTIPWPSGTAVGDLVVAELDEAQPSPPGAGWFTIIRNVYSRFITAADLSAGGFTVKTKLYGLVVFAGSGGTGRTSYSNGVSVKAGGAGLYLAWSDPYDPIGVMGSPAGQIGGIVKDRYNNWNSIAVRLSAIDGYMQSTVNPPHSFSVEITPLAGPPAPRLSAPDAAAQTDASSPVQLAWAHQGTQAQEAYRVMVREGTGSWLYLDALGHLTATVTEVASSLGAASITDSLLTSSYYTWKVQTKAGGLWSAESEQRTFFPANKPTVSGIAVTLPADRLTGSVAWSGTPGAGSIVAWQIAVTPATAPSPAAAMWSSPVTQANGPGPYNTGIPVLDWTNGASYKAWVRVQQGGGLWSNWTSATFTVSWAPVAAPVGVMGIDGSPISAIVTGIPAGRDVEAQWSIGGDWYPLGTLIAPGSDAAFPHPLAPYGVAVSYRARTLQVIDGTSLPSPWTTSGPAMCWDEGAYFATDDGQDWIPVRVVEDGERHTIQGVTVTYPMGADGPIIDRSPVQGRAGSLVLRTYTPDEHDELLEWITTRPVWVHRPHPEETKADRRAMSDAGLIRIAPASPPSVSRLAQYRYEAREISFAWVEQTGD